MSHLRTASISANPNPIKINDGSGAGMTVLYWTSDAKLTEVHIGAPDGRLFTMSEGSGSVATGKWVQDGTVFYLQDVSDGLPLSSENTLSKVTVNVIDTKKARSRVGSLMMKLRSGLPVSWQGSQYNPPVGRINFGNLRRLVPISSEWGLDRGGAIDRYYIENFIAKHANDIKGHVLEFDYDSYIQMFGGDRVSKIDVLQKDESASNPKTTIIADLTKGENIPSGTFDCIICTQVLMLIFDVKTAIKTLYRILKPGGVLLVTVAGITKLSDDYWGPFSWSFTPLSARKLFEEIFLPPNVQVLAYGNVLSAFSFLHGIGLGELSKEELDYRQPGFEVTITVRAVKPG